MKTTKNLAKVFAQALRGATATLRGDVVRAGDDSDVRVDNAIESIDAVAEELEAFAVAPDPDGGANGR